jgi:transposase-like protein
MTFQDSPTDIPDPEVVPKAKRRKFSAEYKLRILDESDNCTEPGQIGALLRREGLYSSHLSTWRRQREQGLLEALSSKKRGRKGKDELERELTRVRFNTSVQRTLARRAATSSWLATVITTSTWRVRVIGLRYPGRLSTATAFIWNSLLNG